MKSIRCLGLCLVAFALSVSRAWATTNVSTYVSVSTPANMATSSSAQTITIGYSVTGSPASPTVGSVTGTLYNSSGTSIVANGVSVGGTLQLTIPPRF